MSSIVIADSDAVTFPRSARLRTPPQFQATFSQGRRISAALFRLHVRLANLLPVSKVERQPATPTLPLNTCMTETTTARFGISVSKRVAANAVERNRIKRIARDSFRHRRAQLPPGDYVLLAQRDAAGASSAELRTALATLWQRAIALKPDLAAPTMPTLMPESTPDPG
jgi:ribonuclease P protein component